MRGLEIGCGLKLAYGVRFMKRAGGAWGDMKTIDELFLNFVSLVLLQKIGGGLIFFRGLALTGLNSFQKAGGAEYKSYG